METEQKHTPLPWKFERMGHSDELAQLKGIKLAEHEGYFRENNGDWIISSESGRIAAVQFKGRAKRGEGYAAPDPEGQANARLIVRAVNSHDGMLRALKHALFSDHFHDPDCCEECKKTEDLLTQLEAAEEQ